jgi:linoleoyl-CoA desaturase
MTKQNAVLVCFDEPARTEESTRGLKFGSSSGFQVELRRRIEEFFRCSGRRQRDCWQMYLKTVILLAAFAASYTLLLFVAATWWQALPLAIFLGLATAGIGFNIQHDGKHQAYSNYPWINKAMAMTRDLIGGSSYIWHWKHNRTQRDPASPVLSTAGKECHTHQTTRNGNLKRSASRL